jgi:hypothetical protein
MEGVLENALSSVLERFRFKINAREVKNNSNYFKEAERLKFVLLPNGSMKYNNMLSKNRII